MRDNISDIAVSYDRSVEEEDLRLVLHQLEYDLTWRYLTRYPPPAGSILEIGPGTGRYTLELCKRGYSVTAVDLSAALLQRCKLRLEAEGLHEQVQLVVADARDLHAVVGTAFDAVLLMGRSLKHGHLRQRPNIIFSSCFLQNSFTYCCQ